MKYEQGVAPIILLSRGRRKGGGFSANAITFPQYQSVVVRPSTLPHI